MPCFALVSCHGRASRSVDHRAELERERVGHDVIRVDLSIGQSVEDLDCRSLYTSRINWNIGYPTGNDLQSECYASIQRRRCILCMQ